jgi:hypothetical protein
MPQLDMREVVTIEKENIEKYLKDLKKPFEGNEKQFLIALMNFFYASAFCERTCDMNESFFAAQQYKDQAKKIYEQIAGKPMD